MLDADQHRRLQLLSKTRGRSMGSLIRESVSEYLAGTPASEDSIFGIIGMLDDRGPRPYGDVGEAHDLYLADAVAAEAKRPRRVDARTAARRQAARKRPKR